MKILVPFKRVADPDNANQVRVAASGKQLDTSRLEGRPNPFDHYALEAALRLTEDGTRPKQRLGEVIVVTLGTADTEARLRNALATGADRAIRIDADDESLDGRLVALALREIVAEVQPDLVLMGKQAVDGDTNQVGQFLAERLDWPMATFAGTIVEEPTGSLLVEREVDGGLARVRLGLPAVITVDLRIVAPNSVWSRHTPRSHAYAEGVRFAPLLAMRQAQRKPLEVRALSDVVPAPTLTTRYLRFAEPQHRSGGQRVATVSELVDKLANEAKVI